MSEAQEPNQEEQQVPFIQIVLDETLGGDPNIISNLPIPIVLGCLELVKQKLFAQFYGQVNQLRAEQMARKPDIAVATIIPPDLRRR